MTVEYRFDNAQIGLIKQESTTIPLTVTIVEPGLPDFVFDESNEQVPGGDVVIIEGIAFTRRNIRLSITEDGITISAKGDGEHDGIPLYWDDLLTICQIDEETIDVRETTVITYRRNDVSTSERYDRFAVLSKP